MVDYLGLGDYLSWSEQERQAFLVKELQGRRPLVPRTWEPSESVGEVLATCEVVAQQTPEALGSYVISMASKPSEDAPADVSAVAVAVDDPREELAALREEARSRAPSELRHRRA